MRKVKTEVEEMSGRINEEISQQRRNWMLEGRCPTCGELGKLDAFGGATCSVHGVYPLIVKLPTVEADQEEWLKDE